MMNTKFILITSILSLILLSCGTEDELKSQNPESEKLLGNAATQLTLPENTLSEKIQASENQIALDIYKDPNCGCCTKWVNYLADKQFKTNAINTADIDAIKMQYGIEGKYQSCHTAVSAEGYIFEGHIPAKFIRQFLNEKPSDAIGLSVPAMPVGTPGMEVGDKFQPYKVLKLMKNGEAQVYAEIKSAEQQE